MIFNTNYHDVNINIIKSLQSPNTTHHKGVEQELPSNIEFNDTNGRNKREEDSSSTEIPPSFDGANWYTLYNAVCGFSVMKGRSDGADQFIGPTQRVINTKQIPVTVHTQLIILNANRSNFLVKFV